jgi:uncharacterized protein YjbJ (UPF0337 family)
MADRLGAEKASPANWLLFSIAVRSAGRLEPLGAGNVIVGIPNMKGIPMDNDRIKGSAKQAKGAIKEAAGKLTGDAKLEADGKADKAEGKIQNTIGGVKDALRGK